MHQPKGCGSRRVARIQVHGSRPECPNLDFPVGKAATFPAIETFDAHHLLDRLLEGGPMERNTETVVHLPQDQLGLHIGRKIHLHRLAKVCVALQPQSRPEFLEVIEHLGEREAIHILHLDRIAQHDPIDEATHIGRAERNPATPALEGHHVLTDDLTTNDQGNVVLGHACKLLSLPRCVMDKGRFRPTPNTAPATSMKNFIAMSIHAMVAPR